MSSTRKEIASLVKTIEATKGFTVERTKNNHWKVRKNGVLLTTFPTTPSDHRSLLNCQALLRRNGVQY